MNQKKLPAILTVIAVTSALLTLSAFSVPRIVNTILVSDNTIAQQEAPKIMLANSKVPVLKIEPTVPVSTVTEYLEQKMTKNELQQIYDYMDNSKKNAISANRKMTSEEVKRLGKLKEQYIYEGLHPKGLLPLKPGNYDFHFNLEEGIFNYPKRSLTDQELLQYIDWNMRIDFAFKKRLVHQAPDTNDIPIPEAISLASESVKKLFDVYTSKLEVLTVYSKYGPGQKGIWHIHFQPYKVQTLIAKGQTFLEYDIMLDSMTGVVIDTTIVNLSYKRTSISSTASQEIKKDLNWIQVAKKIVTEKQGETRKITKATVVNDSITDKRGVVSIKIELDDGNYYTVELRYPDKSLRCLLYEAQKTA